MLLEAKRFHIINFGCKLNTYEAESIGQLLCQNGYQEVIPNSDIDPTITLIVVNSCTVTSKADAKCRTALRRMKRCYPNACIVLTGCMVNQDATPPEEVDILIGNLHKSKIIEALEKYQQKKELQKSGFFYQSDEDGTFDFSTKMMNRHSRAFLKIQDGCDRCCSYCKIPHVRGKSRSGKWEEIVRDAIEMEKNGYRELVLTGINISDYQNEQVDLSGLLEHLLEKTKHLRFRLGSLEPQNIYPSFYQIIRHPRICPHFHIALQSGSDKILTAMNRHYTVKQYLSIISEIRRVVDHPFIATDLIVGFPDETEDDFRQTMEILKIADFSFVHVFGFSPREGTKAYQMVPKIPERIRDQRVSMVSQLAAAQSRNYAKKFLGKQLKLLIEKEKEGVYYGTAENYLSVRIITDRKLQKKEIYPIIVAEIRDDGAIMGELSV